MQVIYMENRPIRLTNVVPNSNLPGVRFFCVLYLHYNVAFTFK